MGRERVCAGRCAAGRQRITAPRRSPWATAAGAGRRRTTVRSCSTNPCRAVSAARLSALDAAFLAIESDARADARRLGRALRAAAGRPGAVASMRSATHIAGRLHRAPRYRQRLAEVPLGLGDPVWVDDPAFDVALHVRRAEPRRLRPARRRGHVDAARARPRAVGAVDRRRSTTAASASSARRTTASSTGSPRSSSWRCCSTRRPSPSPPRPGGEPAGCRARSRAR